VTEEWKRIQLRHDTYPYFVSSQGRVKNMNGKILKAFPRGTRNGTYPAVDLYRYGCRKRIDVHRLVALHFVPNPQCKSEVNHLDLNPNNAKAENLEWCTRSENEMHKHFMDGCMEVESILS
jgi:hypothetical protein